MEFHKHINRKWNKFGNTKRNHRVQLDLIKWNGPDNKCSIKTRVLN